MVERVESGSGREPRFVLVMGVCGVGKTSVARALAGRLGGAFVEGDDFHTPENKARMQAGQALTDEMRLPWLGMIAEAALEKAGRRTPVVIACSALKRRYRDFLRSRLGSLAIVHLAGERDLIADRMAARTDHFMPVAMLDSQLGDLEPPGADEATIVDIAAPPEEIIDRITAIFRPARRDDGESSARPAI